MQISVWRDFIKRKNSTKQSTAEGTVLSCTLKGRTSVENPTFIFSGNEFSYNYIQAIGHYYYVNDVTSIANGLIEVSCTQDLLATYKSDILNTSAFVVYDETANTQLVDTRLSTVTTNTVRSNSVLLRDDIINVGTPIVSILGTDTVGTYIVPFANLGKLLPNFNDAYESFLAEDNPFGAYKALITGLMKTGGNASEYIKDIKVIPFAVTGDDVVYPLMLGNYALSIGARVVLNRISKKTATINIPWQFSDWRNYSPYTDLHMYIPFVGNISLSTSQLMGATSIVIATSLDILTGDLAIILHKDSATGEIIGTYGASTGVSIIFGKSGLSPMNVASGIIDGVSSVATANPGKLVGAGLDAIKPYATTVGGISSGASVGLDNYVRIYTDVHNTNVAPASVSSVMGTPTNAVKSLSTLTGYVQTANASVNMAGFDNDKTAINNLLDNGIFIE